MENCKNCDEEIGSNRMCQKCRFYIAYKNFKLLPTKKRGYYDGYTILAYRYWVNIDYYDYNHRINKIKYYTHLKRQDIKANPKHYYKN